MVPPGTSSSGGWTKPGEQQSSPEILVTKQGRDHVKGDILLLDKLTNFEIVIIYYLVFYKLIYKFLLT